MRDATEIYYTIVMATIFFVVLAAIIVISVWRYYSRKRSHEMAMLQFDHALLQTRLEIQEQTFKSISQELHDNMGQLLSLAKLQLNTVTWDKPDKAREKVNDAIDLVSQTIQSMRDLSRNLHAESIHRSGLMAALETEIRMIEKLGTMQPVFRIHGEPVPIPEDKSLIIFRIVQEALHNVVKHSKATLVEMNIDFHPNNVQLTIADNGLGFVKNGSTDGSGLRNMRDRARVIGAELQVESTKNSGTLITLTIPQV